MTGSSDQVPRILLAASAQIRAYIIRDLVALLIKKTAARAAKQATTASILSIDGRVIYLDEGSNPRLRCQSQGKSLVHNHQSNVSKN